MKGDILRDNILPDAEYNPEKGQHSTLSRGIF